MHDNEIVLLYDIIFSSVNSCQSRSIDHYYQGRIKGGCSGGGGGGGGCSGCSLMNIVCTLS